MEAELARGGKELKTGRGRGERRPRIPEHLLVGEEIIVDPQEVRADPAAWRQTGQEITEQLDYTPARFCRRRIIRRKYARRDEPHRAPVIAKLDTLAERSLAAPGLLAQVIVAKYCDHLPLYRQEQIYRLRHGIELPRQSLARWLVLAAQWLTPVYQRIHTGVMAGGHVQTDETMIEYLKPGNGQSKQGYLWTLKQPGGDAVFVWHTSRAQECLRSIIPADFTGVIGCDGYSLYQSHAAHSGGRVRLAACWAHRETSRPHALVRAALADAFKERLIAAGNHPGGVTDANRTRLGARRYFFDQERIPELEALGGPLIIENMLVPDGIPAPLTGGETIRVPMITWLGTRPPLGFRASPQPGEPVLDPYAFYA